jgi:hypothetical protein
MDEQLCEYCKKPCVRFRQTITRWFEKGVDVAAHADCRYAVEGIQGCPQCRSDTGVKIPRDSPPYCEDCGWPDEDFSDLGEPNE